MKYKKIMDETCNSKVYKKAQKRVIDGEERKCFYCPPHSGCNGLFGGTKGRRNWKRYRKNQYKN